jgi:hypothetical protein
MDLYIGQILNYVLTADDVARVNRRRTDSGSIRTRLERAEWPEGAQAHIGNEAREGQILPLMVCRVWADEFPSAPEGHRDGVNGQVFLDGNDTLWVTSRGEDPMTPDTTDPQNPIPRLSPGYWHIPRGCRKE